MSRYRFDHVAIALSNAALATPLLVGRLGGRPYGAGPGPGYRFWQWEFAGGGRLEVLEPAGPSTGFLHRFLAARGPGIHHVTFKVPDIHAAVERASRAGYDVVGFSDEVPGWKEAFLHPRQAQGIVVQLAESDPQVPPPEGPDFPSSPRPAPVPREVVGLALSARSPERAVAQWGELLEGRCERRGDELHFHWPDSPLRITARTRRAAPEGPLAIELRRTAGSNGQQDGLHPSLGVALRSVP